MDNGFRKVGEFCWINMLTPRPAEAMEFFAAVLGWAYFEIPGIGHGIRVGGRDIGGLFDLHGPNTPPGLPPSIGVEHTLSHSTVRISRRTSLST